MNIDHNTVVIEKVTQLFSKYRTGKINNDLPSSKINGRLCVLCYHLSKIRNMHIYTHVHTYIQI